MKFFTVRSLCPILLFTLVVGQPEVSDDQQSNESNQQIVESLDSFSWKLYSQLAKAHMSENLFYSPMSISMAFSMVSLGATSETRQQIFKGFKHLLQTPNQLNSDLELNIANALFVEEKLNLLQKFKDEIKAFYKSELISVNFQQLEEAKNLINSYVEEKTNGLIEKLLSELSVDTVMVLINTLYFKGSWTNAFNVNQTRKEDFHVDENTIEKVPMMKREGVYPVAFFDDLECTVVKVPYKGNASAIFIIPNKGKLQDVEKAFQEGSLSERMKQLKPKKINLWIPKLSLSKKLNLKTELTPIGFGHLFSKSADLSKISNDVKLEVSQANHQAVIIMNEEGTVAAAATSIGVVVTSIEIVPEVKANKPFILIIQLDFQAIPLFIGRINNPNN